VKGAGAKGQALIAFIALLASATFGATTTTWEMSGYQDFLRGRMNGMSLTRDGRLVLGPKIETLFASDQPEIWTVAKARDGSIYLGTGNGGRLYRIDGAGQASLVWTADQPEIFAITVDAKGVVYAGTSPDGKIYRIENGKAAEYFDPHARYIWALKFAPDGSLFAATGDQGKIYRVTGSGQGTVYYETGQAHVTCLAIDREGRLLAGSEPNGILYRITAKDKAFVLYDANLPEIRAIVPAPDGTIYAAALGGSIARRTNSTTSTSTTDTVTAPAVSITVTDAQAGLTPTPKPEAPKTSSVVQSSVVSTTTETTGIERSAIYKINPDNTVETLWTSKEENAYDLGLSGNELVFVTDAQARVYRLEQNRKVTLIAQANEGEATRLIESPQGWAVATSHLGKILRLSSGPAASGWFESPVHDAGTVARWGRLTSRGGSQGIVFKTRSGNSLRPDATWSDWALLNQGMVPSPNARYIQWRAEVSGSNASFDSVTLAFLPQNTPPIVRSINVSAQAPATTKTALGSSSATAAYSITVTDTGETSTPAGTPSQTLGRSPNGQIQIAWQAEDPDGDKLMYSLYFRGEDEREWKLLKAEMTETTYLLDGDVFADGRYVFKVTASDRLSNPASLAREAELVSAPVLVDNTPPVVTATRNGSDIDVDATDRGSSLRRCEFSIDAGPWLPVEAFDGVTDSDHERFLIHLEKIAAGEHLVVIRVYDAAGNAGLAKVVVR
jgi:sugar lactone lactonase YvrE